MTSISPFSTSVGAQSTGWITSLLLHATLAFGAFVFTQQLNLAAQPAPFKWNVAMVEPTPLNTTNTAVPSAEPAATPETPRPSMPLPRKSMPALTSQTKPLRATPIPATLSPPSSVSKQSTSDLRPASPTPATPTPPVPSEPIAQERTVVRTVEPASQVVSVESALIPTSQVHEPERESLSQTHEPPPQVSRQNSVTEPTALTTPNAPVKPEAASEQQRIAMAPVPSPARADYGWLSDTILRRVEELKRYPHEARLERAEGKVVLKVVIRGDGSVDDVEVSQSSGYRSLDHAAVELLRLAAPFKLPQPLGKSQMTVKIPMNYRLEQ